MSSIQSPRIRGRLRNLVREHAWPSFVIFAMSLSFWLVFSGKFDAVHVGFGVLSAALVAVLTREVERLGTRVDRQGREIPVFTFSVSWPRFFAYLPWLLGQIFIASVQIAYVIVHPRLPISPVVIRFDTRLRGDLARTTLGNSITLTPGTITLDVEGGEFTVHALIRDAADQVLSRTMEERVARAIGRPGEPGA